MFTHLSRAYPPYEGEHRPAGVAAQSRKHLARMYRAGAVRRQVRLPPVWVPEHHCMRGVASAAPAVIIDRVASVTRHLRVGVGGVMTRV